MVKTKPFIKFPSTPHLLFNPDQLGREDKLLSAEDKELLLSSEITIEEKIDGANLGISFSSNGDVLFQNRGHYVTSPYVGQWEQLPKWFAIYQDKLFDVLEDSYILFGEWCYAKHSVYYPSLPNWFIAFDVFDIKAQKFLSVRRRNDMVDRIGLPIVPLIKYGRLSLSDIPNLLQKSAYGDALCEGLYFRLDKNGWLSLRAKYVRETFSQAIEQHWSKRPIQRNNVQY